MYPIASIKIYDSTATCDRGAIQLSGERKASDTPRMGVSLENRNKKEGRDEEEQEAKGVLLVPHNMA